MSGWQLAIGNSEEVLMSRGGLGHSLVLGIAVLAAVGAGARVGSAHAQGTLDAQYSVTLGGIPFGKGAWRIDVRDDQFTAAMSGQTTGLLQLFTRGKGQSAVRGTVSQGQLQPTGELLNPESRFRSPTCDKTSRISTAIR